MFRPTCTYLHDNNGPQHNGFSPQGSPKWRAPVVVFKGFWQEPKEHQSILYISNVNSEQIASGASVCLSGLRCLQTLCPHTPWGWLIFWLRPSDRTGWVEAVCAPDMCHFVWPSLPHHQAGISSAEWGHPCSPRNKERGGWLLPFAKTRLFFLASQPLQMARRLFWFNLGTWVSPIGKDARGVSRSSGPVNVRQWGGRGHLYSQKMIFPNVKKEKGIARSYWSRWERQSAYSQSKLELNQLMECTIIYTGGVQCCLFIIPRMTKVCTPAVKRM